MSEFKHTPGPWRHRYDKYEGDFIVTDDASPVVCRTEDRETGYDIVDIPNEADARLIAAAPEMVERGEAMDALLKQLQGHLIDFLRPDGIDADAFADRVAYLLDGPEQREAQDGWQLLISKIKGEEQ